ncbi:alpha-amylase family glycosyl hydrolase [Leptospira sp. GIMC2001]|uniref:alpha-amylase family glycosyl hydrolase n=1 Tax=Leptospira sp. GIMC2001 TaxID=1513297 RepID=UPI00234B8F1E|nr:alpha-amylase family glycosyl hydrolase [Leptospira sp. GIMC2001]WCL48640.1 alpha-amylase family glycosyl hydrolase [Leptospira sp. GIMC2001]
MSVHHFHQTILFESNTRIFCKTHNRKIGKELALIYLSLPEVQASDCLWTMGIWQPSPKSIQIAREHEGLRHEFQNCLHDLQNEDIIGSPYSVFDYVPNKDICESWEALAEFKNTLNQFGKKLILDFVPNHLSVDSIWIDKFPDAFLELNHPQTNNDYARSSSELKLNIKSNSLAKNPNPENSIIIPKNYFQHSSGKIFAHGRDPYFDGWTDTVQFDFSSEVCKDLHNEILSNISNYCDGLRCDMAMLPQADIFEKTHGRKGLPYWEVVIKNIRNKNPNFIFIAEVYWQREYELQQLGFDFTYDKELYDRLKSKNANELTGHLTAELNFQNKSLRFLENHDEPRAALTFGNNAMFDFSLLCFLPGGILIYENQMNGFKKRIPVQLGRMPDEPIDMGILNFYKRVFQRLSFRRNKNLLFMNARVSIYENTSSHYVAIGLRYEDNQSEILIYNPNSYPISGRIHLDPSFYSPFISKDSFTFMDVMDDKLYRQDSTEVHREGIYFNLKENKSHWMVPLRKE